MTCNGCKSSEKGKRLCTFCFICCHNHIAPDAAWDTTLTSQQPETKIERTKIAASKKGKKAEQRKDPKPKGKNTHSK